MAASDNDHHRTFPILEVLLLLVTAGGAYFAGRQAYIANQNLRIESQTPQLQGAVALDASSASGDDNISTTKWMLLQEFLQIISRESKGEDDYDYRALIEATLPLSAEIPAQNLDFVMRLTNTGPVTAGRANEPVRIGVKWISEISEVTLPTDDTLAVVALTAGGRGETFANFEIDQIVSGDTVIIGVTFGPDNLASDFIELSTNLESTTADADPNSGILVYSFVRKSDEWLREPIVVSVSETSLPLFVEEYSPQELISQSEIAFPQVALLPIEQALPTVWGWWIPPVLALFYISAVVMWRRTALSKLSSGTESPSTPLSNILRVFGVIVLSVFLIDVGVYGADFAYYFLQAHPISLWLFSVILSAVYILLMWLVAHADYEISTVASLPVYDWGLTFAVGTLVGLLATVLCMSLFTSSQIVPVLPAHGYELFAGGIGIFVSVFLIFQTSVPGFWFSLGYALAVPSIVMLLASEHNSLLSTYTGHLAIFVLIVGIFSSLRNFVLSNSARP